MAWTRFMDMHSGGGMKVPPYNVILIEAPEKEARIIFYNRFGRNPDKVTCTCCGEDYSYGESETLEEATAYDRNCVFIKNKWVEKQSKERFSGPYQTLKEYLKSLDVLTTKESEIKPEERVGKIPRQGYVWMED